MKALKRIDRDRGWLAKQCGVHADTVGRWQHNQVPRYAVTIVLQEEELIKWRSYEKALATVVAELEEVA
jgi:hypothetical protein